MVKINEQTAYMFIKSTVYSAQLLISEMCACVFMFGVLAPAGSGPV